METCNQFIMRKLTIYLILLVFLTSFGCSQRAHLSAANTLSPVLVGPIEMFGKKPTGEINKYFLNDFSVSVKESKSVAAGPTYSVSSYEKEGSNKVDVALMKAGLTTGKFAIVDELDFSSFAANCIIVLGVDTNASMRGKIYSLNSSALVK